ncbi:sigma-70 family RNA polymerase sigma factor [Actinokineospora xionganensis]|uniref:Sigma-70 family RNA polymerase sigma factor n=1 Tax=Actinokineospora xionganensis TaxID=2684470 RepID=A0ABR7KZF6_9PSEU|nr:sigma-70 family RNA polymerase sigma factor [Actinokineospora xionganensis]MBC6445755.1 sigma-70 family RNA polymerase sigma factor [Actinokineospora xionganensis]
MDTATVERFEANRNRLASLAYRLLGSAADAEDAVQDAFLRWQAADRSHIEVPEAWLTKVVTNLSLDRLRSAKTRHERAVGDWLPEPLLDGDPMLGPAETAEQRESVTLAVLTLMERLSPIERAVYVLREAFSHTHAEVAEILDISESASQQHAHRARRHVAAGRHVAAVDRASARRIVEAFLDAASSGRTDRLLALLTDDATAVTDGAGLAGKLLRYSVPERVAAMVRAGYKPTPAKRKLIGGSPDFHAAVVNGSPAVIATLDDRVLGVVVLEIRDDKISAVRSMAAPARLGRITEEWRRSEHDDPLVASW